MVSIFFFLLSFFLAYSQRSEIGCLPYFHTWCGLSANVECMYEMWCTRLAEKCRTQKNRHLGTIAQICRPLSSQQRHVSTVGKKYLLNIDTSSIRRHNMVNFGLLTAKICWRVLGPLQMAGILLSNPADGTQGRRVSWHKWLVTYSNLLTGLNV